MTWKIETSPDGTQFILKAAGLEVGRFTTAGLSVANVTLPGGLDLSQLGQKNLSANGYQKLPGGLILQWGKTGILPDDATLTVAFPIAFPNAVFVVQATEQYGGGAVNGAHVLAIASVTNSNFAVLADDVSTTSNPLLTAYWFAIGF